MDVLAEFAVFRAVSRRQTDMAAIMHQVLEDVFPT
jgi:hypothetical protein